MSRQINLEDALTPQDFETKIGVKKLIVNVPTRKPHPQEYFRAHPTWQFPTMQIEVFEEGLPYLVVKEVVPYVPNDAKAVIITPYMTAQRNICLWSLKVSDGIKSNSWNEFAHRAVERSRDAWVKILSNRSNGAYDVYEANGKIPDPVWPEEYDLIKLINIGFKDRVIATPDHPIIQRLQGIM